MMLAFLYIVIGISFGTGLVAAGTDWKSAGPMAAAWPWHLGQWVVGWFGKK